MPTENRSSNTETESQPLAQHPEGRRERFLKWVLATKHPVLGYLDGTWLARGDDREGYADKYVQGLWVAFKEFAQPAPQPHPEPIAWMVGTAFWWTKEEAERDAAATRLPIVGLGPMTALAPEHHQGEPVAWMDPRSPQMHATISNEVKQHNLKFGGAPASAVNGYTIPLYTHADSGEVERLRSERDGLKLSLNTADTTIDDLNAAVARRTMRVRELESKLAEQDAMLRKISGYHWSNVDPEERAKTRAELRDMLSPSAGQSAPAEADEPVCKGAWQLGTACGKCRRCRENSSV